VFDHRAHNIDRLRRAISLFDWSVVTCISGISATYARFLEVLTWLVHMNVPVNVVRLYLAIPLSLHMSLSSCYVNGITQDGKVFCDVTTVYVQTDLMILCTYCLEANSPAEKINLLITHSKNSNLTKPTNANSKQLWAAVKSSVNSGSSRHSSGHPLLNDVHAVNDFLANISFLSGSQGCHQVNFSPSGCTEVCITDYELEPFLT